MSLIAIPIISWSLAFVFIKMDLSYLSFINLTLLRFCVVVPGYLLLLIIWRKRLSPIRTKDIPALFSLGFFGVMVYHFGLNYGEQYVSPGAASLIVATIPVFVLILATIFLNEHLTSRKVFGVILSLLGVIVISIWGTSNAEIDVSYLYGALAVLVAALMGALYTIAGKKLLERYSGFSLTIYAMLLGSFGLLPFFSTSLIEEATAMPAEGWIAVLFLGVVCTVISYALWYMALAARTASEISIYLYAVPIISTIIGYFKFNDAITPFFLIGGVLVIIGLFVVHKE